MSRTKSPTPSSLQVDILEFIHSEDKRFMPPSIREIGQKFKISSTSVTNYQVKTLTRLGLLKSRPRGMSRGLKLTVEGLAYLERTAKEGVKEKEKVSTRAVSSKNNTVVPLLQNSVPS